MVKSRRYRKKRSFKSRTRKQKLWNQKGCSHTKCKSCHMCHICSKTSKCLKGGDSAIAPLSVSSNGSVGMGGGCGCSNNYIMGGGSTCGTCMNENCSCASASEMMGGAISGPTVGNVWGPNPSQWPGANGIGGDRNLLPYNTYQPVDISRQMALRGGKKSKKQILKRKKSMRGGGIMPQDLLNLGRDFAFNMESAYNSIRGIPAPVNPLPYKNQLMAEATRY